MAVPRAITDMGASAHDCGDFDLTFDNPKEDASAGRTQLTRSFHVYLELAMQAKHDQIISGYCRTVDVQPRKQDGAQVKNSGANGAAALAGFYVTKAETAAEVAKDHMVKKWANQAQGAAPVFTPGVRVDAAVQNTVQSDDYSYEISYWYDGQDIYVLYHCYPA